MRILQSAFTNLSRRVHTKRLTNLETLNIQSKAKAQSTLHDLLINMPKEQPHIPILKSARKLKKEFMSGKYPAGFITLQILGNGAKGAPASLYMFTDQSRYLFNCGEGSQRLAHEHKMKLAKLEHVFLTSSSWDRVGGLPGLALTIQDIGVPSIALHGPPGIDKLFEGTRRFVILKDLQIHVTDCISKDKFHEDHIMRVDYIPIYKSVAEVDSADESIDVKSSSSDTSLGEEEDQTDYYAPIKGFKRHLEITKEEGAAGPDVKKGKLEDMLPQAGVPRVDCVICYVCKPKEKSGALMVEKCMEFGVPSGPLLGKLKSGFDVTLKDGRVVRAADVRSPDLRSPVFIIVDCPNEAYLDALVQHPEFEKYQNGAESEEDSAHIVVHFTPKQVMEKSKYIQWMDKFRISTKHILVNDVCNGMGSEAVHRIQHKLNLIDENMFPLLKGDVVENLKTDFMKGAQVQLIMAKTLLKYNLRPSTGLDDSAVVILNPADYVKETMETEDFPEQLKELKARFASMNTSGEEYPKIVFLGTGSCIPNKTRNTSGMLLHVNEETNMILDCGEGTFGQLVRFFGPEEVDQVLIKTKAIYVSHLHADHHLGLINLLHSREHAFTRQNVPFTPVFLIAPHQIQSWLYLYHKNFEKLKHLYSLVASTSLIYSNSSLEPEFSKVFHDTLDMKIIETIGVRHCPNAYGIAVTGKSGWKITYSGDTMPCDFLVTLGLDSDLLIHEATMEDELKHEAELKMHSTTSEAIGIGKKMRAKFILLTHFSQRYSKVPKINGDLEQNVGIAFDNMRVSLRDLPKLPMMYPTLKTMFAESYEEMENKTTRKLMRIERDKQRLTQP